MQKLKSLILFCIAAVVFSACQKQELVGPDVPETDLANSLSKNAKLSNDVAIDWMQAYRQAVQVEGKNPPQASRIYAYAAVGLYEAVVQGMGNYTSLEDQISGLTDLPKLGNKGSIDFSICANEALYQISLKIFGTLKPANIELFNSVYNDYKGGLSAKPNVIANSVLFGKEVAIAVLNRSFNDNFANTRTLAYLVPSSSANPSYWSPTSAVTIPLEPYWGTLKCFAMANGDACTIKSKIPFSTTPGSVYYNMAVEVVDVAENLSNEQKDIANWWADAGGTSTPPGHWVGIGAQVANHLNFDLGRTAELFAKLNIAMADAFISCWNEKYTLNLLRPVTYIQKFIPGKSSWTSYIGTPPFPEYPSGHSVASGAASDILTRLVGNVSFTDETNVSLGIKARSFSSFTEAANEAAMSRLYGGIHYREAIENGLLQGVEVSKVVSEKIRFRK